MRLLSSMMIVVSLLAGCGAPQEAEDVSQVHYITFGSRVSGLVARVKTPRLRVCLSGVGASEQGLWTKNIESAILKWVQPMRQMTSVPLTSGVDVVASRTQCDTEVQVSPGTHSNTSIGQYPVVRMSPTGYFASFNVLLHEFGHGFALSDTYQNGQSGNCRPGQPQAVMCNTSFSEPQADDIAGLSEIFKRVFPNDKPGTIPPENAGMKISLAIGKDAGLGKYDLHAAVLGTTRSAQGAASYCVGTRDSCSASGAFWTNLSASGRRGEVALFALPAGLAPVDGLRIMLRYQDQSGSALQAFGFEQES